MDLDSVADELYGLLPGEFTRRRDARALEARRAGDRGLAAAIKALRRPATSAWMANILVRERPDHIADLVELGAAMRQAQADLAGADLRKLAKERHRVVAALAQEAGGLARDLGEPVSSAASKELGDTLEAAIFDAGAADALRSGRLTMALRYSGLGAVDLTGAVGPCSSPSAPATPAPDRRRDMDGHGHDRRTAGAERAQEDEVAEREWLEADASAAEAGAAAAAADEAARALGQRVTEAGDELDRIRAAVADVTGELERLRAAEVQARESVDDVKEAYDAAGATSLAAHQRVAIAKSALEQATSRRGRKPSQGDR